MQGIQIGGLCLDWGEGRLSKPLLARLFSRYCWRFSWSRGVMSSHVMACVRTDGHTKRKRKQWRRVGAGEVHGKSWVVDRLCTTPVARR